MIGFQPDLSTPSFDEGWAGDFSRMGVLKKPKKLREAKSVNFIEEETFDDTFKIQLAQYVPPISLNRLREAQYPPPAKAKPPAGKNPEGSFSRGVPTNDATSSQNYKKNHVKIIDGEHKTLLCLGKINEAMEDDEHPDHIMEHRMLLASGDLTETQRNALVEHISDHAKKNGKRLRAAKKAQEEAAVPGKFKKGFGFMSKAKKATTDSIIPQDSEVSTERKRTAGMMSMESGSAMRRARFDGALRSRRGL